MKKSKEPEGGPARGGVIPLKDLVPRQDPKGGAAGRRKTVFGGGPAPADRDPGVRVVKKRPGRK